MRKNGENTKKATRNNLFLYILLHLAERTEIKKERKKEQEEIKQAFYT